VPPLEGWLGATLRALRVESPELDLVCAAWAWPAAEPFEQDGVSYVTLLARRPQGGIVGVQRRWMSAARVGVPVDAMRHLISQVRPDVVHVHGTEDTNALAMLQVAERTPVLVSLQGLVTEIAPVFLDGLEPSDVIADIASVGFIKGQGVIHSFLGMKRAARTEPKALAAATDVIGRTEFDREVALGANPRVRYWHVDEVLREPFYETEWSGLGTDPPVVLAVASAAPYKGIDVLLRAYAILRDRRPCRLVVAGAFAGTSLWRSLDALQSRLGLSGHVEWVGAQDAASVARLVGECSVFASASRIENSSNSVCEAMIVGAPIVATSVGGTSSLLADGESGLLVGSGDPAALASAIERILADEELAARLGRSARIVAAGRHDPTTVARRLLEVYSRVADEAL
jgi:glycosyltransferase involved in cell wall biosynthesis